MRNEVLSTPTTRRHRRAFFSVPIALHHLTGLGVRTSHGVTLNLSEGGMGALVQDTLHVGDTVSIDLPVAKHMLNAVAIVRHTSSAHSGFEFVGLTAAERKEIAHEVNGLAVS